MGRDDGCKREIQDKSGPISGGENPWDGQKYSYLFLSPLTQWYGHLAELKSFCLGVHYACLSLGVVGAGSICRGCWSHCNPPAPCARLIQQISNSRLRLHFHLLKSSARISLRPVTIGNMKDWIFWEAYFSPSKLTHNKAVSCFLLLVKSLINVKCV